MDSFSGKYETTLNTSVRRNVGKRRLCIANHSTLRPQAATNCVCAPTSMALTLPGGATCPFSFISCRETTTMCWTGPSVAGSFCLSWTRTTAVNSGTTWRRPWRPSQTWRLSRGPSLRETTRALATWSSCPWVPWNIPLTSRTIRSSSRPTCCPTADRGNLEPGRVFTVQLYAAWLGTFTQTPASAAWVCFNHSAAKRVCVVCPSSCGKRVKQIRVAQSSCVWPSVRK